MRLADYVVKFLEGKGVNAVFTVSGGGSIHLCDALGRANELHYYCCHHEQAVSMAAEGYARASGRPGVGIVTTGPGGTNAITGVACAWMDSIPQLIISGQVYLHQTIGESGVRQMGVQEINIIDLVRPITKYAAMVRCPEEIRIHLETAWHQANHGRPGPVWVDIPGDLQQSEIDPEKLEPAPIIPLTNHDPSFYSSVDQLVGWLTESQRPLLHIGHGVRLSGACDLLLQFAERYQIPIATTWNATDVIDSSHPLFVGRPGAFAERGANFNVQNADLVLAIGTRLPFTVTGYQVRDYARNARRVMVDIDAAELAKTSLDLHLTIQSDAGMLLEALLDRVPADWKPDEEWLGQCQSLRQKYPIVLDEYRTQVSWVSSYYFIEKLSEQLKAGAVVVTDMGLAFVGTHQAFQVKRGQVVCTNSGHAPMGWGLPAAIGACIARGKQPTVCIAGDGGLMMNLQELSTLMHHDLPVKIFIYNNEGYLTIKQTQQLSQGGRLMGATPESGVSFPDFHGIAEAHGLPYVRFSDNQEMEQGLAFFLDAPRGGICELMIDPEQPQVPKAVARRGANGKPEPTAFEDLYPHLLPGELASNLRDNRISEISQTSK